MKPKLSSYRGIDVELYKFISEVKEVSMYDIRRKFVTSGYGGVRYSINSLKHKGLIEVTDGIARIKEKEEEYV